MFFVAINNNGEVKLINKKGCEILGYREEEVIGKNWFDNFIPHRIKDELLPISMQLLRGEEENGQYYVNPVLTKQGVEKIIEWCNTPLKDEKGRIIGHFSYGNEINEKKKLNDNRSFIKYDKMHKKYKENLKEISRKLLLIREEEKKRLSIDLHDEIGAMSINLGYNLYLAEKSFKENDVNSGFKYLEQIKVEFNKALRKLKNISIDMRPPQVDTFEIQDIINMYVSKISKQSDINIKLELDLANNKLNEELKLDLYRVLQESLNNVIKHSEAENVKIKLSFQNNNIKFIIRDDGKGFDLKLLENTDEIGMGIWGMKERVESCSGIFSIKSKPDEGTAINITIPVKDSM